MMDATSLSAALAALGVLVCACQLAWDFRRAQLSRYERHAESVLTTVDALAQKDN